MSDDDRTLVPWLADRARGRRGALAVGVVTRSGVETATVPSDQTGDHEIGSISKAITGLLYTDAISSGVLAPDTRIGDLLDLGSGPIAAIAVSDLATHRSGLPRLPAGMHAARRTWDLWRHGTNPYGDTLAELLEQARGTAVGRRRFRYSNLGFELLGHGVASARSTTYADLLRRRLTEPLALAETYAPVTPADLRPQALTGCSRGGRPRAPWTGEALAPAGGIRSTVTDMTTLMSALLDGSAPGVGALDPVTRVAGPASIGAAWMSVPRKAGVLTWHNGQTGGFASWLGLDRAHGHGVVVLSSCSRSVDRVGMDLLDRLAGHGSSAGS